MEKQIECVRYYIWRGYQVMWGLSLQEGCCGLFYRSMKLGSFISVIVGSRSKDDGMRGIRAEVCQNQPKAAHRTNG